MVRYLIHHDGAIHHPKGGASYYFGKNLIEYLNSQCTRPHIKIYLGTQPNSNPHIGNITTFATAFSLASALKVDFSREATVKFIYVESAPAVSQDITVEGIRYQRSLKHTGDLNKNQTAFTKVLEKLSLLAGVPYEVETQDYWRSSPSFAGVVRDIVAHRQTLGPHMSPGTGKLALRAACPHPSCGLADKHGINNQYHDVESRIAFTCPVHGEHSVDLGSPKDVQKLEFNTPLRNLVRVRICSQDKNASSIMCTGSDYSGFYQEQLLWRLLDQPSSAPIIFYSPLILDWAGSKLSKSLYVEHGAYKYLRDYGLEYMLENDALLNAKGGLEALLAETQSWVAEPYRLFRSYSIEYLHNQLRARGMQLDRDQDRQKAVDSYRLL